MSSNQVEGKQLASKDSNANGLGECVDEDLHLSNRSFNDIQFDSFQDGFDEPGLYSQHRSLSPRRGYHSGLSSVGSVYCRENGEPFHGYYGDSSQRYLSPSYQSSYYRDPENDSCLQSGLDGYGRSRYDLPPKSSRYASNQYEEFSSLYEPLSPRYPMESSRWGDNESTFSLYDRGLMNGPFPKDPDNYPASYTYGMRQPHSPTYSSFRARDLLHDDLHDTLRSGLYDDSNADLPGVTETPFSFPASPRSSMLSDPEVFSDFSLGHVQQPRPYNRFVSKQAPSPPPVKAEKESNTQTALTSSGAQNEEGDDGNYRIDSQAIMQNKEERTVVLIRNIPNRYKLEDLSNVIASHVDGSVKRGV